MLPPNKPTFSQRELDALFLRTNFSQDGEDPEWTNGAGGRVEIEEDGYVYIHEGDCLGDSLIQMAGTYENGGFDGYFLQELIRLYRRGKLKVVE